MQNLDYLDYDLMEELCKKFDLHYTKCLLRGSFDQVTKFNVETFESTIYEYYNLPKIENNYAEGIVIKPNTSLRFGNHERVIIKMKRSNFEEVSKKPNIKIKNNINNSNNINTDTKQQDITDETKIMIEQASRFVTVNRLYNVMSKINLDGNNTAIIKKITGLFIQDALKDFIKEYDTDWMNLSDNEKQIVKSEIKLLGFQLVEKHNQEQVLSKY